MYAVITIDAEGEIDEVEFFSERPRTPHAGMLRGENQDEGNGFFNGAGVRYSVYEGNLDGGDSILLETENGKIR